MITTVQVSDSTLQRIHNLKKYDSEVNEGVIIRALDALEGKQ